MSKAVGRPRSRTHCQSGISKFIPMLLKSGETMKCVDGSELTADIFNTEYGEISK